MFSIGAVQQLARLRSSMTAFKRVYLCLRYVAQCDNRTVLQNCSAASREYYPRRAWKGIHTGLDLAMKEKGENKLAADAW